MRETRFTSLVLFSLLLLPAMALHAADTPLHTALTIWVGSDKGYRGLEQIAERYRTTTGWPIKVQHFDNMPAEFERSASSPRGPDIILWAHDRFGEWAQKGLISTIAPSPSLRSEIAGFSWDAVTSNGRLYGYPIAVEAVGLIYNRRYTPQPIEHFEALPALDRALRKFNVKAITWDYPKPYFSWSLLSANGGYAFKRVEGRYDTQHSGINHPGAVIGATLLQQLIEAEVIDPDATESALQQFIDGKAAMMINGPWVWGELKRQGIDFKVAPIPKINGQPGKPLVGVWAAAVVARSHKKKQAVDFIENYMLTLEGLKTLNRDAPLGAPANKKLMGILAADPNIDTTFDNASNGQIMPNTPRMIHFWKALSATLKQIAEGVPPQQALDQAHQTITTP